MSPQPHHDYALAARVWALGLAFEARLARELVALKLSVADFRLIGEVMGAPAGLRQSELSRRLGVTAPTVSAAVSRLERAGVLRRRVDPDDPRAKRVYLSEAAPLEPGLEVLQRLDALLRAGLSAADRKRLPGLLDGLTGRLSE